MQISMWVPYDEKQLRRTLLFILRPQFRTIRIAGAVLVALGVLLIVLRPDSLFGIAAALLGVAFAVAVPPLTLARSVKMQSDILKEGLHMTLDDEAVTVTYPLVESRFKWAGLSRVVETPEVWYLMLGKVQAVPIPKVTMTEQQRAEFAAFARSAPSLQGQIMGTAR